MMKNSSKHTSTYDFSHTGCSCFFVWVCVSAVGRQSLSVVRSSKVAGLRGRSRPQKMTGQYHNKQLHCPQASCTDFSAALCFTAVTHTHSSPLSPGETGTSSKEHKQQDGGRPILQSHRAAAADAEQLSWDPAEHSSKSTARLLLGHQSALHLAEGRVGGKRSKT